MSLDIIDNEGTIIYQHIEKQKLRIRVKKNMAKHSLVCVCVLKTGVFMQVYCADIWKFQDYNILSASYFYWKKIQFSYMYRLKIWENLLIPACCYHAGMFCESQLIVLWKSVCLSGVFF